MHTLRNGQAESFDDWWCNVNLRRERVVAIAPDIFIVDEQRDADVLLVKIPCVPNVSMLSKAVAVISEDHDNAVAEVAFRLEDGENPRQIGIGLKNAVVIPV